MDLVPVKGSQDARTEALNSETLCVIPGGCVAHTGTGTGEGISFPSEQGVKKSVKTKVP